MAVTGSGSLSAEQRGIVVSVAQAVGASGSSLVVGCWKGANEALEPLVVQQKTPGWNNV